MEESNHGNLSARSWLARSTREIKDGARSSFEEAEATIQRKKEIAEREAKEILVAHELNR